MVELLLTTSTVLAKQAPTHPQRCAATRVTRRLRILFYNL